MASKIKDFSDFSDDALVLLAQQGDFSAEACIIERHRESVKTTAAALLSRFRDSCTAASLEFDDLFQEGLLGLLSAIYSFNKERNVTFRTYAGKCISNSIKTVINASLRKKHIPPGNLISIEEIDIPVNMSLEDKIISAEGTQHIRAFLKNGLSELEFSVIRLHLSSESYSSIASILNISEKSVGNALQRARIKLSRFLKEQGS